MMRDMGKFRRMRKYRNILIVFLVLVCGIGIFCWQANAARSEPNELWGMADAKEIGVHSKMSGRVLKIYVQEGDAVKKGQVLAQLDRDYVDTQRQQQTAELEAQISQLTQASLKSREDTATLMAAVSSAEAKLASASADYELAQKDEDRYAYLLSCNAVSQQVYDSYHNKCLSKAADLNVAQAELESARAALTKIDINSEMEAMRQKEINEARAKLANVNVSENETQIVAPYDGIITKKYIEEGSMVGTSAPLFSLQDQHDNWVNFKIKETEIGDYYVGQELRLVGRDGKTVIIGTVASISKKPDYATVKATSERGEKDIVAFNLKVQTDDERIWPGMRFRLER